MALNGKNIIVLAGGQPIAAVKSDDIQTSAETIETSSPGNGAWRTRLTKRKDWKLTTNYLVMSTSALHASSVTGIQDLLQVGNEYAIVVRNSTASTDSGVKGTAILTRCKITASVGRLVTGSFEFEGNGELAAVAVSQ